MRRSWKHYREGFERGEKFKAEWIKTALEVGDSIAEPEQIEYSGKLLPTFETHSRAGCGGIGRGEHQHKQLYRSSGGREVGTYWNERAFGSRVLRLRKRAGTTITITRKTPGGETTIGNLLETPSRKPTNSHAEAADADGSV